MRIRVLAVGSRMPDWVRETYADYAMRLRTSLKLQLLEIPLGPRGAPSAVQAAVRLEGKRILVALRPKDFVVALDEKGDEFTTREFATWLEARRQRRYPAMRQSWSLGSTGMRRRSKVTTVSFAWWIEGWWDSLSCRSFGTLRFAPRIA